jgi:hypothetical protein
MPQTASAAGRQKSQRAQGRIERPYDESLGFLRGSVFERGTYPLSYL